MLRLECAIQTYDWGKPGLESAVAQLKQEGDDHFEVQQDTRYAELWMGTHPSGPSTVIGPAGFKKIPLKDYLDAHPKATGSASVAGGDLPFMFKVLSIAKALSIQAHPDKCRAEALHATRPQVYKDANHKPEMAISLTPFEALCGFRPLAELLAHFSSFPEFKALVDDDLVTALAMVAKGSGKEVEAKEALRKVFSSYMEAPEERAMAELSALVARLERKQEIERDAGEAHDPLESLILRLEAHYPGDRGVLCPLFLNYVRMGPGRAFVMEANEPHAYLSGDILECMACSDNVVRVGLTPKYRDVPTLLEMLTCASGAMAVTEGEVLAKQEGQEHRLFSPGASIPEFEVETIKLEKTTGGCSAPFAWKGVDGPSLLVVLEGAGEAEEVRGSTGRLSVRRKTELSERALSLHKGQVFLVPANTGLALTSSRTSQRLYVALAHANFHGCPAV